MANVQEGVVYGFGKDGWLGRHRPRRNRTGGDGIAENLLAAGFQVIGLARSEASRETLRRLADGRLGVRVR